MTKITGDGDYELQAFKRPLTNPTSRQVYAGGVTALPEMPGATENGPETAGCRRKSHRDCALKVASGDRSPLSPANASHCSVTIRNNSVTSFRLVVAIRTICTFAATISPNIKHTSWQYIVFCCIKSQLTKLGMPQSSAHGCCTAPSDRRCRLSRTRRYHASKSLTGNQHQR